MAKSPDLKSELALAKRSGVAQSTINRLLKRQVGASVDTVDALADAFGVHPWLLIHPNPDLQRQEAEFYARMRALIDLDQR